MGEPTTISTPQRPSPAASVTPRSPRRSVHHYGSGQADSHGAASLAALAGPMEYEDSGSAAHEGPLDDLLGQVTELLSQVHDILG